MEASSRQSLGASEPCARWQRAGRRRQGEWWEHVRDVRDVLDYTYHSALHATHCLPLHVLAFAWHES
jgi:hypothetical protein